MGTSSKRLKWNDFPIGFSAVVGTLWVFFFSCFSSFCSLCFYVLLHTPCILRGVSYFINFLFLVKKNKSNNSITFIGMTHSTSKRLKIKANNSLATLQWRRRRSMDSPLFLCMQHQSATMTFFFLRLSKVGSFPRAVVHTKKFTLDGTLTLQIVLQGNDELDKVDNV
jgi:hypothetical protein